MKRCSWTMPPDFNWGTLMPSGLDQIFFTNSGSEAVDTALKIALAYHRARGEGQRTRLIGRKRGYHGVGFGGISVSGIATNRKIFSGALLPATDYLPHTHSLEHNAFSKGQLAWDAHLADGLERLIALHDASTIAAVIVEPLGQDRQEFLYRQKAIWSDCEKSPPNTASC